MELVTPLILFFFFLGARVVADVPLYTDYEAYREAYGDYPSQGYNSSNLVSSVFQANTFDGKDPRLDQQPFIFANGDYGGRSGPVIYSSKDLSLVWTNRGPWHSTSVQVGTLYGERVITAITPIPEQAVMIFNQRYDLLYTVGAVGQFEGHKQDPHEAYITDDDTVILIIQAYMHLDVTAFGGNKNQLIRDGYFQEINPKTDELIFEWSALKYFNLTDSHHLNTEVKNYGKDDIDGDYTDVQDFAHINSVQKLDNGDYLVSGRHLWSVWLVDGKTGAIKWILGGKRNQFKDTTPDGSGLFRWQHDARMIAPNRITVFDNHYLENGFCDPKKNKICSRGLEVEIDLETMTFKKVAEWFHPQSLISASRGGVERLPNGNTLIAWGQNPMYTEHAPDGTVLMDIQRGPVLAIPHGIVGQVAYRVYKGDWVGMPPWGPNMSAIQEDGRTKVSVSWNGATEVDKYLLMTSDEATGLRDFGDYAAESPRTGFETDISTEGSPVFARVAALNSSGHAIGITPVVKVATGKLIFDDVYKSMHEETVPNATDQKVTEAWNRYLPQLKWVIGVIIAAAIVVFGLILYLATRLIRRKEWWGSKTWNASELFDLRRGWSRVPLDEDENDNLDKDTEKLLAAENGHS